MARPSKTPAAETEGPQILPAVAADIAQDQTELALADQAAGRMAVELGYDGALTVPALEDGIRFYQRRTVEACLELGKRLLLLKELTPHGEFEGRIEALGFSHRMARKFMQAAAKTAGKAVLEGLSKQVKNATAFLELVTADDEVLEDIKELDGIDRMSASELRAALREAKEEREADAKVLADKNARIDKLAREVAKTKKRIEEAAPDEELAELKREASALAHDASGLMRGNLRLACKALHEWAEENDDHAATGALMAGLLGQVEQNIKDLREEFNVPDVGPNPMTAWVNEV